MVGMCGGTYSAAQCSAPLPSLPSSLAVSLAVSLGTGEPPYSLWLSLSPPPLPEQRPPTELESETDCDSESNARR